MKFARTVFLLAGIWGVLVITPLFFIFDLVGRQDPPPITHPGFYYGFATTALAWQIAFFVIASNPLRLRPLMIPSFFEKLSYLTVVVVLYLQGRMRGARPGTGNHRSDVWRLVPHRVRKNGKRLSSRVQQIRLHRAVPF